MQFTPAEAYQHILQDMGRAMEGVDLLPESKLRKLAWTLPPQVQILQATLLLEIRELLGELLVRQINAEQDSAAVLQTQVDLTRAAAGLAGLADAANAPAAAGNGGSAAESGSEATTARRLAEGLPSAS
jgi:hypothetical protein